MENKQRIYDVSMTVVMVGSLNRVPKNPTARCAAIIQQLEYGAYDFASVASYAFNDLECGGQLIIVMTWENGISVWAAFDCTDTRKPIISSFHLETGCGTPVTPESPDDGIFTSTYVTLFTSVDYTYRDVIKSLTIRVTEVTYEHDNPVVAYDRKGGTTERTAHGGFPGDPIITKRFGRDN